MSNYFESHSSLESQSEMEVVGEACNSFSALQIIQQVLPDVMTVDLSMPGGNGFELLRQLKVIAPFTRFVALTMHDDSAYFRTSVSAGAKLESVRQRRSRSTCSKIAKRDLLAQDSLKTFGKRVRVAAACSRVNITRA